MSKFVRCLAAAAIAVAGTVLIGAATSTEAVAKGGHNKNWKPGQRWVGGHNKNLAPGQPRIGGHGKGGHPDKGLGRVITRTVNGTPTKFTVCEWNNRNRGPNAPAIRCPNTR